MRLHFKPMPGLTIVTAICLAILISLGTWQYQRLQWKTGLLAEIEEAATAAPIKSFSEVQAALAAGEPIDFRRYGSDVMTVNVEENFYVFTPNKRDISWRVFAPVQNNGIIVFADLAIVSDEMKNKIMGRGSSAEITLVGYIRAARSLGRGATKSSPEKNRWFGFNPMPETHSWAEVAAIDADMRFYIDKEDGALDASELPIKRPDIRNNHFDYMLTWYSFAIILFVIYLILHARAGRLGYKRP